MTNGFAVWGKVLGINAAVIITWIIFYDVTINILLNDYVVPLISSGAVPQSIEDNFKTFYFFWPLAIMLGSIVWGILVSGQKDYYEYGGSGF